MADPTLRVPNPEHPSVPVNPELRPAASPVAPVAPSAPAVTEPAVQMPIIPEAAAPTAESVSIPVDGDSAGDPHSHIVEQALASYNKGEVGNVPTRLEELMAQPPTE